MSNASTRLRVVGESRYWRPALLVGMGLVLLGVFWFTSRYPSLLGKARHVGQPVKSMAFTGEVIRVGTDAPVWQRILAAAVNWLDGMKVGMSFGVLFGALLLTVLRYYPLKVGPNPYWNTLKGALVGLPMGVCANCAVPVACGVTRGKGREEMALGFLFSSPNFNPIVVLMTFTALPLSMGVAKYGVLLLLILVVVPTLIRWFDRGEPAAGPAAGNEAASCGLTLPPPEDRPVSFPAVLKEVAVHYGKGVWALAKPTLVLMLLGSVVSAALITLLPWESLLSDVTPLKLALLSVISVFMPVPIGLDVMFPAQLEGVPAGYVMMFAMTLGTYSIIPSIYLWREVSKPLAVSLFVFFVVAGWVLGLVF